LRKRIANYFLINQSILDLIIGVTMIITSQLSLTDLRGTPLYLSCYLINSRVLYTGFLVASTWNLAAMSVERYFEIVHPVRHKMKLSKKIVIQYATR
jgi:7 transmembrane receptor (rhodopsin family)